MSVHRHIALAGEPATINRPRTRTKRVFPTYNHMVNPDLVCKFISFYLWFAMHPRTLALAITLVFLSGSPGYCQESSAQQFKASDLDFFESSIRPLLMSRCHACHRAGNDTKGELDLGSREALLRGGTHGPAAVPGKSDDSLLVQMVRGEGDLKMPPDGPLSEQELSLLEAWITRGLPWTPEALRPASPPGSDHWAFQKLHPGEIPKVQDSSWPRTSLDYFVLSGIEAAGLTPNQPATRRELIRRLTYDLTGLPPTPAEITAFLQDQNPNAYEALVDRLLASPRYGECWGRHWLDVVRYADSKDLRDIGARQDITATYKYRDWVVKAFNGDLPYNQFMMDQIAGDLRAIGKDGKIDPDRIIATGMLAFGVWGPGDSDVEKMHTDMVDDMINVTSRSFLGLTVACARCHDHKFDPISQEDYYALAGIFFSSEIAPPGTSAAWIQIPLVPDDQIEEYNRREMARKKQLVDVSKRAKECDDAAYQSLLSSHVPETARYLNELVRYLMRVETQQQLNLVEFVDRESSIDSPTESAPLAAANSDRVSPRPLRKDALEQWLKYLEMKPRQFADLDKVDENAWGQKSIYRWHTGAETPFTVLNSSDRQFDVPSVVANTYFGRIIHTEGPLVRVPEHFDGSGLYLGTDDGAPTNGIVSLLFRAPSEGRYDISIRLKNCVEADSKRDAFFYVVVNGNLKEQGRLRGYGATASLSYDQLSLNSGDTLEVCASSGGVSYPAAIMETAVLITSGDQVWDAAKEFHSPNAGSPIVSANNPLAGNVWEYGYRIMLGEMTDRWAFMNPSEFAYFTTASEDGPDSQGATGSGPDLNIWSTPNTGRLPARSLAVHPGKSTGVGVEWISSIDGYVEMTGNLASLQGMGDGVQWQLQFRQGTTDFTIASGILAPAATQALELSPFKKTPISVLVRQGDVLRLSIYPNQDNVADITGLQWNLREVGGRERHWDLVESFVSKLSQRDAVWRLVDLNPAKMLAGNLSSQTGHEQEHSQSPLQIMGVWLQRHGFVGQAEMFDAETIRKRIDDLQSQLDLLNTQIAQDPGNRIATILASNVGPLYIELVSDEGPFHYEQRDDKALLPPDDQAMLTQLQTTRQELEGHPTPMYEVAMGVRDGGVKGTKYEGFHDAQIHMGGQYATLGKTAPRGFPKVIAGNHTATIPTNTSGRLQLAEWIADPANPLPARVMVNRIWLHHFGQGLVRTPGNFGILGDKPSHPQLLDHLAQQFINSNWSIKSLHRQIVLSSTYRQSSHTSEQQLVVDPDNTLWSRMFVRRLEAEAIRDSLLAVSGQLDEQLAGPVVRKKTPDADALSKRRALYLMTNRSDKSGFRFLFDAADPENVVDQRNTSTVAPQALFLLNHPFVLEQLPPLAERASAGLTADSSDAQFADRINLLYNLLYSREATSREIELATAFIRETAHNQLGQPHEAAFQLAWQQYCQVLLCADEMIYLN